MDKPTAHGQALVEVERRFLLKEDTPERIIQAGGILKQTMTIHDVYYDTGNYQLAKNDHWLRCRDDYWQLKCLPLDFTPDKSSLMLQYAEHESVSEILRILTQVLERSEGKLTVGSEPNTCTADSEALKKSGVSSMNSDIESKDLPSKSQILTGPRDPGSETSSKNLAEVIDSSRDDTATCNQTKSIADLKTYLTSHNCHPFANLVTTRTKYTIGDDIVVDLDQTNFNYSCGEIEIVVPAGTNRDVAVDRINKLARTIGVYSEDRVPSKLFVYLHQHHPGIWVELMEVWGLPADTFNMEPPQQHMSMQAM